MDEQSAEKNLLQQFFFYLLPSFFFIVAAGVRLRALKELPLVRKSSQMKHIDLLLGQLSQLEEDYDQPPDSYLLKIKLSMFNSLLYLLMLATGVVASPAVFYASSHRAYSLCYLVGAFSWYLSAALLKLEFERGQAQSIWCHRSFWPLSCTFQVLHLIEQYQLYVLNMVFNLLELAGLAVLTVYALFKWVDANLALSEFDEDTPAFARNFFIRVENDPYIRHFLGLPPRRQEEDLALPLLQEGELLDIELKTFKQEEEQRLFASLPRRNIALGKEAKLRLEEGGNKRYFYLVLSQFGDSQTKVERKVQQFKELAHDLQQFYSPENFRVEFPALDVAAFNRLQEEEERIAFLEKWLRAVIANPFFVHEKLLKFLEIPEAEGNQFRVYMAVASKKRSTPQFREKFQRGRVRNSCFVALGTLAEDRSQVDEVEQQIRRIRHRMEFCVEGIECCWRRGEENEFRFSLCYLPNSECWSISKSFPEFKAFHKELETRLKTLLPQFYRLTSKIPFYSTADALTLKRMHSALVDYLREILSKPPLFAACLFKFIEFDVLSQTPTTELNEPSLSSFEARTAEVRRHSTKELDVTHQIYVQS